MFSSPLEFVGVGEFRWFLVDSMLRALIVLVDEVRGHVVRRLEMCRSGTNRFSEPALTTDPREPALHENERTNERTNEPPRLTNQN
jgi:hypothetical protein